MDFSRRGALERAEFQAEQAWSTRKTFERKRMGYSGELSTSPPRTEVPEAEQEAPNVSGAMLTWEMKWLLVASATPILWGVTKFENRDVGTARQVQRPGKLRTMC